MARTRARETPRAAARLEAKRARLSTATLDQWALPALSRGLVEAADGCFTSTTTSAAVQTALQSAPSAKSVSLSRCGRHWGARRRP